MMDLMIPTRPLLPCGRKRRSGALPSHSWPNPLFIGQEAETRPDQEGKAAHHKLKTVRTMYLPTLKTGCLKDRSAGNEAPNNMLNGFLISTEEAMYVKVA